MFFLGVVERKFNNIISNIAMINFDFDDNDNIVFSEYYYPDNVIYVVDNNKIRKISYEEFKLELNAILKNSELINNSVIADGDFANIVYVKASYIQNHYASVFSNFVRFYGESLFKVDKKLFVVSKSINTNIKIESDTKLIINLAEVGFAIRHYVIEVDISSHEVTLVNNKANFVVKDVNDLTLDDKYLLSLVSGNEDIVREYIGDLKYTKLYMFS